MLAEPCMNDLFLWLTAPLGGRGKREGYTRVRVRSPDPFQKADNLLVFCTASKQVREKLQRLCSLCRKMGEVGSEKQSNVCRGTRLSLHRGEGCVSRFSKDGTRAGRMAASYPDREIPNVDNSNKDVQGNCFHLPNSKHFWAV